MTNQSSAVKTSNSSALKDNEGNTYFSLDDKKRVTIKKFKNQIFVDIREYYLADNNK